VPRPVWFRLFGPNVPTTFAEFRDALLNFQVGQGDADGRSLTDIRALLNLPTPGRPTQPDSNVVRELNLRDLPIIAAGIADRLGLGTIAPDPGPGLPGSAVALIVTSGGDTGPNDAAEATNHGTFSVQVQLPWPIAYGLRPITENSASEAKREPNGWVERYLHDHAPSQSIAVAFMPDDAAPHWENWAGPAQGTLSLAGDFAGGFLLTALPFRVDGIALTAGNNYVLASDDDFVAAGGTLVINAMELGAGEHVVFDGTAESDGRFIFYGGDSGDTFIGGAGNDLIEGGGGADILAGGDGGDTFVWRDAAESSGADFDILADFDPAADRIDLEVEVSGFDAAIAGGSLSEGSFDADLGAALAGLGAGRAVLYAPDAGDLAGTVFLVVDANGVAGYQAGEDYVFALTGATLAGLSGHTDFFI
jgi:Ca2+-binding RTX toxin-like protein